MARNNVLKDDGSANAVAISNAGQFNVDSGVQTVGVITGTGTTSINADVNNPGTMLNTPQINQAAVNVNGGSALDRRLQQLGRDRHIDQRRHYRFDRHAHQHQ